MRQHGTKTTPVFLHADGVASWLLIPSLVFLLSGRIVQPEAEQQTRTTAILVSSR